MSIVLQRQIFQTKDTHDTSTTMSAQNLESFKLNGVDELYFFLSIFRLRISWNSSSVWLKVIFLFGTANWEEQLKIKSNWESTDITISAWNRKCRWRKRLVLSRHIHIHVKLLIVTVLRDDTSCKKMALVLFFMTYVPQGCEESPDWELCLVLARRPPSWICRRRGGRAPCKE